MPWVRLEDTFPEHPKVAQVGGDAAWLHVCAIAYSNRNLTDGFIPDGAIGQLSDRRAPRRLAERLDQVGIWHRDDDRRGYVIHDFHDYNPTRDEVEADRAKKHDAKAAAGRIGGIASGIARRKQTRSTREAEHEAEGKQNEAPTRPPLHTSNCDKTPTHPHGGMKQNRTSGIADAYARMAVDKARRAGKIRSSETKYGDTARQTALENPELERLMIMFPTAPDDVIAAALHGEKHSLAYHPRADEIPDPDEPTEPEPPDDLTAQVIDIRKGRTPA